MYLLFYDEYNVPANREQHDGCTQVQHDDHVDDQ